MLEENGDKQLLCGDLNARHRAWDNVGNERGTDVYEVVNRTPITYICAASVNSYYKVVYKKKKFTGSRNEYTKVRTIYTSNPDIVITRTPDTVAHVQERNWGKVSDHLPVTFLVKAKLKLSDTRRRIAKSLFYCPKTIKDAQKAYRDGVEEIIEELGKLKNDNEDEAQRTFVKLERFITEPWDTTVRMRPSKKPLWWHKWIGNAHQRKKKLARQWHKLDYVHKKRQIANFSESRRKLIKKYKNKKNCSAT